MIDAMRVLLVCQFGKPIRGLSPYGDALWHALQENGEVEVEPIDYRAAYPAMLHPAEAGGLQGEGELSWFSPASWWRVALRPGDILHIQHWAPPLACYLWPLARLARLSGKRVVITVHNPVPHERAGLFAFMENRLMRSAHMILAHGELSAAMIRERLGTSSPPVKVIAHGLNPHSTPVVASRADYDMLRLNPAARYIVLFGNLRGYKGIDILLDAWQRVAARFPDVRLVIAGRLWSGSRSVWGRLSARMLRTSVDARSLQARLQQSEEIGRLVIREGFQSDADLDALIRVCEFAVFPYVRFSGQSGAACRAAAGGRAVLVTRTGSLPDLVIDESWVVTPGSASALAQRLAEKLDTAAESGAIGARQLAAVSRYSWQAVARHHVQLYQELA